jgi:excisionase family DNA binding protein
MPLEQSEFWTGRKLPRIQRAPLLSVADVAEDLNLSIRTIRRLIAQQKLSVVRIGRAVRVRAEALDALLDGK